VPQIRPLADIVHSKYAHTYLLTERRDKDCEMKSTQPAASTTAWLPELLQHKCQVEKNMKYQEILHTANINNYNH